MLPPGTLGLALLGGQQAVELYAWVPRHFQWNRGGLDGHWMMPCDDTRGNIWTIAGAW